MKTERTFSDKLLKEKHLKNRLAIFLFICFGLAGNVFAYEFKNEVVAAGCASLSNNGRMVLEKLAVIEKELGISIVVTSGNRFWKQQLDIMLNRQDSYRICQRFKDEFGKSDLTQNYKELSSVELEWWKEEIMERADTYFPHVGGNAVDIRVYNFNLATRLKIAERFEALGGKVIMEAPPRYDVQPEEATVFHLTMQ